MKIDVALAERSYPIHIAPGGTDLAAVCAAGWSGGRESGGHTVGFVSTGALGG